ncbi:MAG: carboxypeptidase-like regulatory domain-containing protein [Caldilineaceae bacterium]
MSCRRQDLWPTRVRIQLSLEHVNSDETGYFVIPNLTAGDVVSVTAWAPGYYNELVTGVVGGEPVTLDLRPHYIGDNHKFEWASRRWGGRICQLRPLSHEQRRMADGRPFTKRHQPAFSVHVHGDGRQRQQQP